MKVAYIDCFSGISGDMVLGALVDAGCEIAQIESHLRQLPLSGWEISAAKVSRQGLRATHVSVQFRESHHHRSLSDILAIIRDSAFPPRVSQRASAVFRQLAEAEARVHDLPIEKVHFHEVGAVDAMIDIVGTSVGLELLGVEEIACSALNVGGGRVNTHHGLLPVPAPATAELLRGVPTYSNGIEHELVTPTGAAITKTLASRFGAQPAMTVGIVGYGAGTTDLRAQPNILRVFIGEATEVQVAHESVVVLEANLDDMNPQIYGYLMDRALAAGALDVFLTPVQMKKNRPGQLVTMLCDPSAAEQLTGLIFRETTTLGVRRSMVERRILKREVVAVETRFGLVRVKVGQLDGSTLSAGAEYDDCRKLATEHGVPLRQVMAEASFAFRLLSGSDVDAEAVL